MDKRKNKRKIASRETIIRKLKEATASLEKEIKIDKVYLFGSYANGNPRDYSDVDVAVISPDFGKNFINETVFLMEFFHKTGLIVEPHVYTRDEYKEAIEGTFLYDEVIQKGITI